MPSFLLHIPSISEILHLYKEDVGMEIYSWVSSLFLSGGGQTLTSRGVLCRALGSGCTREAMQPLESGGPGSAPLPTGRPSCCSDFRSEWDPNFSGTCYTQMRQSGQATPASWGRDSWEQPLWRDPKPVRRSSHFGSIDKEREGNTWKWKRSSGKSSRCPGKNRGAPEMPRKSFRPPHG